MESFMFFVTGALLMYLILQKPLQITIHRVDDTPKNTYSKEELEELEEEMLKEDPKNDEINKKLDEVLVEVNDVMGGSDR